MHQIELEMQNETLRQTQADLVKSRDRYMDLYEFAPVGYVTLNKSGLIEELSLTAAALLKRERRDLVQQQFSSLVAQQDREGWQKNFHHAVKHGGKHSCELTLILDDGTAFEAGLDYLRIGGQADRAVRLAVTDITARKKAEVEMRIAAIAFESHEGMVVTDPDGVILRVNRAFTRLTGFSAQEAIGRKRVLLVSGRQDKGFYQQIRQTLIEEKYWQGEMWNRRKNGELYAEWLTISAVVAPDGTTTHYVGAFSEVTKDKEAEAVIRHLAYYDALTNLPNRRLLHDRISQALVGATRSGHHAAVVFLDLDNFKSLNDTRGHDIGDQLLVEMARRILANVRAGDTVARLGGDEFVLIFEDLSPDGAAAAAQVAQLGEKIREAIAQPCDLGGIPFQCTASFGVALSRGQEESVTTLLKNADLAMYKAKGSGRNTMRFFNSAQIG
ncbi:diguanylate cyclase domain-containing protein [Magnetospirillum moscoviense]|uniref:diguanylate cyclase domain-containing protein n=1 Tax=Magnetospirillum moscoviense TaxID=1437059 RepID=UPI001560C600|nr:diguanylate cyclase [Magnetospirillum moscoviense]MBF0324562.1 diguanylate cyclase [Alphaproteobacteria bacterium]